MLPLTMTVLMSSVQGLSWKQIRMTEYLVSLVFAILPCSLSCQVARKTTFPYRSDMLCIMFYNKLYTLLKNIIYNIIYSMLHSMLC